MVWPFKKKARKAKTSEVVVPLPQGSFLEAVFSGSRVTASKAMQFYRQNSSVATAVDLIADSFEQIKPVIMTQDEMFVEDHPILDLLKKPNGFDTWSTFAGKLARHYLLKHDSHYAAAGRITSCPLELWSVKPTSVSTIEGSDNFAKNFLVTEGPMKGNYSRQEKKREVRFLDGTLKEFFHIKGFSSRYSETESDSPLEAAALETRQQIKGRTHNLRLLENGGRLSLLVAFKDDDEIDQEEHDLRKQRLNEQLGGAENAGKIAVLSNADISNLQELGKSNKDMDYSQLDNIAGMAIFRRYKIPLPLVFTDATTFNNMQTAIELLYDFAVLPLADALFNRLTLDLLPRCGDEKGLRITYNPESINALKKRRLEEVEKRRGINIETTNELRELLPNRGPIQGGDTLYQSATMVPVGEDVENTFEPGNVEIEE